MSLPLYVLKKDKASVQVLALGSYVASYSPATYEVLSPGDTPTPLVRRQALPPTLSWADFCSDVEDCLGFSLPNAP